MVENNNYPYHKNEKRHTLLIYMKDLFTLLFIFFTFAILSFVLYFLISGEFAIMILLCIFLTIFLFVVMDTV
jgi:lipopolysaccharide export LptBFGC system permease protein LptF